MHDPFVYAALGLEPADVTLLQRLHAELGLPELGHPAEVLILLLRAFGPTLLTELQKRRGGGGSPPGSGLEDSIFEGLRPIPPGAITLACPVGGLRCHPKSGKFLTKTQLCGDLRNL